MHKVAIDPVTRVEGHLKVSVDLGENNRVSNAYMSGQMYRGFENILVGKNLKEAIHITQRICGICPVPHASAAVKTVENALRIKAPDQARVMRALTHASDLIADHILHFYHLALLDYIIMPGSADVSTWTPNPAGDYRFSFDESRMFSEHYVQALAMRRAAQHMGALWGGKLPHVTTFTPGGMLKPPTDENIAETKKQLEELIPFIENTYIPDVLLLAQRYPEYEHIGRGPANFMSFGGFRAAENERLFKRGMQRNGGETEPLSSEAVSSITEHVQHAWYEDTISGRHPSAGMTRPKVDKPGGYSWLKAPRLLDLPFEVGPLARMRINGLYAGGISVMDRHKARSQETALVARSMQEWVKMLDTKGVYKIEPAEAPAIGSSQGLEEAPRGALGHWLQHEEGKITGYQIISPTCWNASPRDDNDIPGPMEQAMAGVELANPDEPIELTRIIKSFDPCTGCAVHMIQVR